MTAKRIISLVLTGLLAVSLSAPAMAAPPPKADTVTILFTHDMHSHLLPATDENGNSYGGYARLKTAIDQQKALYPDALLVDGGDFSMGSLFQTAYATHGLELRVMGALGYDATTFGNHEYDYRASGLASMLNAALDSGEPLPTIVEANYKPPVQGDPAYDQDAADVWTAWERYGIQDYTVIQRGGVNFAVFGLMGQESHSYAPMSGMVLGDPIETAQAVVDQIQAEVPEPRVVVCLSHSGTTENPKESEDQLLAKRVEGIDVIVSGHSHTLLTEPLEVNGTYIVSAGEYCKNLGVLSLTLNQDGTTLADYALVPINDTLPEDSALAAAIEGYKTMVEESYLTQFGGLTFDQVLAENPYLFDSLTTLKEHKESTLGNLISDAYYRAAERVGQPVDFALTANGVIRESLPQGEITVSEVFNIASLGIGPDGIPGYPLVSVWITGEDLKNAFEVDASVTGLMPEAQLHFSGMTFTFNPHRMLFNRLTHCAQVWSDGTLNEIEDDKLYRVVTGLYCGQMLGAVKDKSFGILNITPRDAEGNEITDLEAFILRDQVGREVKEWYALAAYLEEMGTISDQYSAPEGRKIIDTSWNPSHLLTDLNSLTIGILAAGLGTILLAGFGVRQITRRKKRKQ